MKQFNLIGKLADSAIMTSVQLYDGILQGFTKKGVIVFTKVTYEGEPVSWYADNSKLIGNNVSFGETSATGDGGIFPIDWKCVFDLVQPMDTFKELPLSFIKDAKNYWSKEPFREPLHGVGIRDGYLWATDAHVMAYMPYESTDTLLLPSFLIESALKASPVKIGYSHNNTHLQLKVETKDGITLYFQSQKMDCKVVDYSCVLPEPEQLAMVEINKIVPSIEKVAMAANRVTGQVKLTVKPDNITLYSCDVDLMTEATDVVTAESTAEFTTALNYKYFVKIAKSLKKGIMNLNFTRSDRAILIEGSGPEKYLLMPVLSNY